MSPKAPHVNAGLMGVTASDVLELPWRRIAFAGVVLPLVLASLTGFMTLSGCIKTLAIILIVLYALARWSAPPPPDTSAPSATRRTIITDRFHPSKLPKGKVDYIVIGSGMSGLTCAAILSRMGYKVLVLEQHDRCGGGSHTYELGTGYQFDAGLHYTVPWSGPLINFACDNKTSPVIFDKMGREDGVFDKIVIGDNFKDPFTVGLKHKEAHLPELYEQFPEHKDDIDRFISASNTLLLGTPIMIMSKLFPVFVQKFIWKTILRPFSKWAGQPALQAMRELVKNKKLASLFMGLWVDTGARPDTGTFFLMASVIRGLPREGGSYPRGGSQKMAMALVETIERNGGRVLTEASVQEILLNDDDEACGVLLADGTDIDAKCGVVSSAGYPNTFGKLIPEDKAKEVGAVVPINVPASYGYVMVNCGYKGCADDFGIENLNVWYHPSTKDGDIFEPLTRYFEDPFSLKDEDGIPAFITFPSVKDQAYESEHPGKLTVQVLTMAKYSWFEKYENEPAGKRGEEYTQLKEKWKKKSLETLWRFYPQLKGKEDFIDVSTPLSIEHYLKVPEGGAVGLEPTPERYSGDGDLLEKLDIVTPIPKLYMTGQDTLICGVVLAQASGIISAMRIIGFVDTVKLVVRTLIHGG